MAATGCDLLEKSELVSDQPEIMEMKDCGLDRLKCCDAQPPCFYAQACCTDPNDPARNYCADQCTTGGNREFCNLGEPKCNHGFDCYQGNCRKCGGENEPCCSEQNNCDGGLTCHQGKCANCGLTGNPCCAQEPACLAQGSQNKERAECLGGVCQTCGYDGKRACPNEPYCQTGNLHNNNNCLRCGQANQPCCDSGADFTCDPKSGLKCKLGFCVE